MTEKEESSPIVFCPNAEVYVGMERFYHSARRCKIDDMPCFGWDEQEKQEKCPIRKYGRGYYNMTEGKI